MFVLRVEGEQIKLTMIKGPHEQPLIRPFCYILENLIFRRKKTMKKTLAILMAALMLLGLTACSSAPEATTEPAATAEQTEQTAAPAEE